MFRLVIAEAGEMKWNDAQEECEAKGTNLATVESGILVSYESFSADSEIIFK